jgi:Amt family ammonium transporter
MGAGLLWFGWYGFNAGSALGATDTAALALINTQVATAAGLAGWLIVERFRDGHPTSLGAASGAVAGLVAITPACAFIVPWAAVILGVIAGAVCAMAVGLKYKLNYDDSLDVVGVHLVGGIIGCLFIGFFGTKTVNSFGADGVFNGGGWELLGKQALGAGSVLAYSFIVTLILGFLLEKTIGFRISKDDELEGIDVTQHLESAYDFEGNLGGTFAGGAAVKHKVDLTKDEEVSA